MAQVAKEVSLDLVGDVRIVHRYQDDGTHGLAIIDQRDNQELTHTIWFGYTSIAKIGMGDGLIIAGTTDYYIGVLPNEFMYRELAGSNLEARVESIKQSKQKGGE